MNKSLQPETREIEFNSYLKSIVEDKYYHEWKDLYTPITAEDQTCLFNGESDVPHVSKNFPRLKLQVETIIQAQEEPIFENAQKVERLDVLEGLRKYAGDYVLLIGRPGSGKTTALECLLWQAADSAMKSQEGRIPVLVRLRRCTSTIEKLIKDFFSGHQRSLELQEVVYLLQ